MEEESNPKPPGRQLNEMDSAEMLRRPVPYLRQLLEEFAEWKHDVKFCIDELQVISQLLRKRKIYLPKDCNCFCQFCGNENRHGLQFSSSDNYESLEADRTGEGHISEKEEYTEQDQFEDTELGKFEDIEQGQSVKYEVKDVLGQAIDGREKSCCNLDKDITNDGTPTCETYSPNVQGPILGNDIPENRHKEQKTVTVDHLLECEAGALSKNLNYSDDSKDKNVENESGEDNKYYCQETNASFQQQENAVDSLDASEKVGDFQRQGNDIDTTDTPENDQGSQKQEDDIDTTDTSYKVKGSQQQEDDINTTDTSDKVEGSQQQGYGTDTTDTSEKVEGSQQQEDGTDTTDTSDKVEGSQQQEDGTDTTDPSKNDKDSQKQEDDIDTTDTSDKVEGSQQQEDGTNTTDPSKNDKGSQKQEDDTDTTDTSDKVEGSQQQEDGTDTTDTSDKVEGSQQQEDGTDTTDPAKNDKGSQKQEDDIDTTDTPDNDEGSQQQGDGTDTTDTSEKVEGSQQQEDGTDTTDTSDKVDGSQQQEDGTDTTDTSDKVEGSQQQENGIDTTDTPENDEGSQQQEDDIDTTDTSDKHFDFGQEHTNNPTDMHIREENSNTKFMPNRGSRFECGRGMIEQSLDVQQKSLDRRCQPEQQVKFDMKPLIIRYMCIDCYSRRMNESCHGTVDKHIQNEARSPEERQPDLEFKEDAGRTKDTSENSYPDETSTYSTDPPNDNISPNFENTSCTTRSVTQKTPMPFLKAPMDNDQNLEKAANACPNTTKKQNKFVENLHKTVEIEQQHENNLISNVASNQQTIDSAHTPVKTLPPESMSKDDRQSAKCNFNTKLNDTNFDLLQDTGAGHEQKLPSNIISQDGDVTPLTKRKNPKVEAKVSHAQEHRKETDTPMERDAPQQEIQIQTHSQLENVCNSRAGIKHGGQTSGPEIRPIKAELASDDSKDQGNVPMSETSALQKGLISDKKRRHNYRQADASHIPHEGQATEEGKKTSSRQSYNGYYDKVHHYASVGNSPSGATDLETNNNAHDTMSDKGTCPQEEQFESKHFTTNERNTSDVRKENYVLHFIKEAGSSRELINRQHEATANDVVINVETPLQAGQSEFDSREMRNNIDQNVGLGSPSPSQPIPSTVVRDWQAMQFGMEDEENRELPNSDTVRVHLSPYFEAERRHPQFGSSPSFADLYESYQALHGLIDDVNTESPTSFSNHENYRLSKAQSMESLLSTTESLPPFKEIRDRLMAEQTCTPVIAPPRLLASPLPIVQATYNKLTCMDDQVNDLTSAFNCMEMRQRIKTVPKIEPKTQEETRPREKRCRLLPSHKNLGPATPDKSIAFMTFVDCCRPIRADSLFNIVLDTVFNEGDALHTKGQGIFVAPFHGLYLLRLRVETKPFYSQELSIGIEIKDHVSDSQIWLCVESISSRVNIIEKTVVLKPGDSVYVKVEHVRGYNLDLQSVRFEGHSLYRATNPPLSEGQKRARQKTKQGKKVPS